MSHYNPANDPAVTNGIQEAYGLKIGNVVEYTNPDGGKFGPHIVVGFVQEPDPDFLPDNTVYIDSDSPWYPVKPTSLRKCEMFHYKLISTGGNGNQYGLCEVCGERCSDVFHQIEIRDYTGPDGKAGETHEGCHDLFGHKNCLLKKQR